MNDPFANYTPGLESPAIHAVEIVPDDSTDVATPTRALNVAVDGMVRVTTLGGDTVSLFVAAGGTFPIRAQRVWATGTTATGIIGLF